MNLETKSVICFAAQRLNHIEISLQFNIMCSKQQEKHQIGSHSYQVRAALDAPLQVLESILDVFIIGLNFD